MASRRPKYRVIRGISWYDDGRAEAGEVRDDIPKASIGWLLQQGHIELVEKEEVKPK